MTDVGLPHNTSLSNLSESDWQIIKNSWCRGIDWVVSKVGSRWEIASIGGHKFGFPLFKTKSAAYEAITTLILTEARYRAAKENGIPTYN